MRPNGDVWPLDRSNEVTGKYAAAVVELASELSLPVVELWKSMQETEVRQLDLGEAVL